MLAAPMAMAAPSCKPSAFFKAHDYPGAAKIPTSNNLILPAGKAVAADGQPLIIQGRVRDKNCAPVAEAIVELWQSNPYGKLVLAERRDLATPNATFAGAGRTYTNGDGEFTFITAFPAPSRYTTPIVNLTIKADPIKTYTSALFFSNDERNAKDAAYKKLSDKVRSDATITMSEGQAGSLIGTVDIVLDGKAAFQTY
jgi:protocatechuate 3,4-dioxygenase, beta subunit